VRSRPLRLDSVFSIFSVTKAITNVLVLRSIELGRFALTTRISDLVPEFSAGLRNEITVHHLLTHTSGLPIVFAIKPDMYIDRLDEVVAAGIPCAVATSASRFDVDRLLGRLGLRERFDAVVTAEDVRLGKPDPEVYLLAARGIGVPPRECLVFEDSVVGIQAARRAGMRVIGVATAHTADELRGAGAASVIDDFEGLEWPA